MQAVLNNVQVAKWVLRGSLLVLADFTITSLNWTYDGAGDASTLAVCTKDPFATFLVFNLLVASDSIGERQYSGVMNESSSNCIYFNDDGYQPLPSSETIYTLIVDGTNPTLKSSVRFAFGVIVSQLDCNGTKLLRLNAGTLGGELTDQTCPASTPVDQRGITCYVPDGTPKVCVTNVDESHVDLEVCVTGLKPTSILPSSSELSAETLSYGDSTLAINNPLVSELLIRAALEDFNFKSCTAGKCVVSSMTSGDILYEYCGVLTDETGISVTVVNTFQDIHLELEDSATSIDFRFSNRYDAGTYLVYGTNVSDQIDGTTDPIHLDCSRIEVGAFCYGFYYSESSPSPTHIAISYSDYSNTVISPVLYTN
ncbi:uncharacterized protein LOC108671352 [Hyalella azteca]|uniref:Uncharacterized protein LOC108671352 n=1 Tax=Hyalella azteca TaxID=294128 RepID=A0A8B7NL30_HYAAZ|nr:uncharacterized protein LOC108671352 [Hyalella azteca]